ncbi:MAG: NADH-quinone oxidoreductase subunit N [Prevotellaceae bacterium]|nr:NADH-quinone oxidoreductase subunit N [Prevotellaceae bacterium]
MIPEVSLMLLLVVTFILDFASSKKTERKWFNPVACIFMLIQVGYCVYTSILLAPYNHELAFLGDMYITSQAINLMKTILAAGTLIVLIQSRAWLSRPEQKDKEGEFYMLVFATLLGMNMMMSAGHFLMFFLALEMASIPMACLAALDKKRNESAEAGAKFILTAIFSSGVMLFGISMIYGACGTLYFYEVAGKMIAMGASLASVPLLIAGMVFFFSGLGFKISLVPFHFWTADTYQGAPTTVTGYLSVISKGAAAFTLMMILYKAFGPLVEYWDYVLYAVIVLSITIANLFAIRQKDLKRFMAFSSISQAGYIMLAVVGEHHLAATALVYYVLVYIVANLSVFTIISTIEQNNNGCVDMDAYNGLYKTNPKLAFLMTLALFSLGGIPPFAGFFSKFFVFMAATEAKFYLLVFIALINTVVSLFYYLLIVKAMYINQNDNPLPYFKTDGNTKLALVICTLGVVFFGICSYVYDWIYAAM